MTSARAKMLIAGAVAAGGAAGVLGAVVAAAVIRPVAPALAAAGGPSVRVSNASTGTRDPYAAAHRFHERLEGHGREPVDPSWARDAQIAYRADLRGLATDAGFSLGAIDCRSTSCTAQLTFASFAAARGSMQRIVLSRWTLNCAKEMNLDPATDGTSDYTTSIYFDCARARASGMFPGE